MDVRTVAEYLGVLKAYEAAGLTPQQAAAVSRATDLRGLPPGHDADAFRSDYCPDRNVSVEKEFQSSTPKSFAP